MSPSDEARLQIFRDAGALLEGHFLLTSGLHSPRYLQCALLMQDPARAERLCRDLAQRFADRKVTCVMGPALGGIIVAHELARALGVKGLYAERENGKMALRRGFGLSPGDRVLLVEDVVTTGGSLLEILALVQAAGAGLAGVAALADRTSGRDPGLGMPLEALVKVDVPTYKAEECPLCRAGIPIVKPGSRATPGKA